MIFQIILSSTVYQIQAGTYMCYYKLTEFYAITWAHVVGCESRKYMCDIISLTLWGALCDCAVSAALFFSIHTRFVGICCCDLRMRWVLRKRGSMHHPSRHETIRDLNLWYFDQDAGRVWLKKKWYSTKVKFSEM